MYVRTYTGQYVVHMHMCTSMYTSNKNIHFEMILDVGIGEKTEVRTCRLCTITDFLMLV